MRVFGWWLVRFGVWLCTMDALSWMLGVKWWHAMLIGFVGVLAEESLGMVCRED